MNKTITILLLVLGLIESANSQTNISSSSDGRFIGNINGEYHNDPTGMLQDFTIGIEWWTLLGEPVENYGFLWNTTGSYKTSVNGKTHTISRDMLGKYPDLLNRFNNIEPVSIDIIVYGAAKGNTSSVKRGSLHTYSSFYQKGSAYKKDGQSYDPYSLSAHILYEIKNMNILTGKSGKMSYGLSPSSPKSWNYFLSWKQNSSNYFAPNTKFDNIKNKDDFNYNKLSEPSKNDINTDLKHLFNNSTSFLLKSEIANIIWPETEMKNIANEYLRREDGGKWNKTKDITNDWGEFPEDKEIETYKVYNFVWLKAYYDDPPEGYILVSPIVSCEIPVGLKVNDKVNYRMNKYGPIYCGYGKDNNYATWELQLSHDIEGAWSTFSEESNLLPTRIKRHSGLDYGHGKWGTYDEVKKIRDKFIVNFQNDDLGYNRKILKYEYNVKFNYTLNPRFTAGPVGYY